MASLTDLYYTHIANKERENPGLDYYQETKGFLQGLADQHAPGKTISDDAASKFLATALPDEQASGMRVFGNFLGRMYPNLVEGVVKSAGMAGDMLGEVTQMGIDDPMGSATVAMGGGLGLVYTRAKRMLSGEFGQDIPEETGSPVRDAFAKGANSLREMSLQAVKNSHEIVEPLTPDWAKERATSFTGSLAEYFGESIIKDIPLLVATHSPGAAVGELAAEGMARVAPKLFGNTIKTLTTTIGPKAVTQTVTVAAGQEGVKTLTQKILSSFVYDVAYGVPQGIGLTMGNADTYSAVRELETTTDPARRAELLDKVSTRIGEDQFFNVLIGAGLAPIMGGLSRLLPNHAELSKSVREVIQTVGDDGRAPVPVSDQVGQMMKRLLTVTDPVERQALVRQIEFTHADEASTQISEWVERTKDIIKDDFSLSRKTGSVLTSWRDQLDQKIQTLNGLIEQSGAAPVEAHLQVIEKLSATANKLDRLYKDSGLQRLDDILYGDEQALSGSDKLLKGIFNAVDLANARQDPLEALAFEPPTITWMKGLNQGTLLTLAAGDPNDIPKTLRKASIAFIDKLRAKDPNKDVADHIMEAFFNPEAPMDRAAIFNLVMDNADKIVRDIKNMGQMATEPERFERWFRGAVKRQIANGTLSGSLLENAAFEFKGHMGSDMVSRGIFGIPDKLDIANPIYQSFHNIQQLPMGVIEKTFGILRQTADKFFGKGLNEEAHTAVNVLEAFYSRFRVELSRAMGMPTVSQTRSYRGAHWPWNSLIEITPDSGWSTSIHEMAHHFERLLPSDVVRAFQSYFKHKNVIGDPTFIGAKIDAYNNMVAIPSSDLTNSYWGSFSESFARYFQNIIGEGVAKSPANPLQMSKEDLQVMRAAAATWMDTAERFYGGREHALLAREVFGLIVDDLDSVMLRADKKMAKMSLDVQNALENRVPEIMRAHRENVEHLVNKEMLHMFQGKSLDSDPVVLMKRLLADVDKTLNITHENKTMEQLVNRFFHLKDLFKQHIVRNDGLRTFYESVVFNGNKKIIADLETGFLDTKMINAVLDATDDPRALHSGYEQFKNFVMQADEILSGAYQHSPQVWITQDTKGMTSSLDRIAKNILRKIPYYRDREGLTVGISRLSRLTDQAEFLIKKMPLLKPVYGAWERHMQDSRKFLNEVFEGTHKGMDLQDGHAIQEYFALTKDDPKLAHINTLLEWSNDVSNQIVAKVPENELPALDEWGKISREDARKRLANLSEEVFDDVYRHYTGVRHTLGFILKDMRSLAKHKQLLSDSELLKITQRFGQLRGYIPQTRKGKFMLQTTREIIDSDGSIVKEPVLIFSDDLAHLRELQKTSYPGASVGRVQKKMDFGHFSTNAAAIDKLLTSVADKKGLDSSVMAMIKEETANLLKSGSFLSSTIERRNVAGWDTSRIREGVYEYMQNYSRFRHKHDAMQESLQAISYLTERKYTEGWKWAQNLIHDMNTSTDSYKPLEFARNAVIFKMLGYNVSSAMMQITQNSVMALPRMVLEGLPRSGRLLIGAMSDIIGNKELGMYEQRALREGHLIGVTYANNINALTGNVQMGSVTSSIGRKVLENSMFMMRKMEELNRQSTLLAAYRGIREQLLKDTPNGVKADLERVHIQALERAVIITKDAHLTYDKINRPEVLRGGNLLAQTGRQFYLLKQFSHGYFQLFSYMMRNGSVGQKAAAKSLLALAAMGGFNALPGYEQLSEGFKKLTGKDANEHMEELMGFGGRVLGHGMSSLLPSPLGRRLNPMPQDVGSLVAPPGMSLLDGIGEATKAFENGDYVRMFWNSPFIPNSVGNIAKSVERYAIGHTTRSGKPIKNARYTPGELVFGSMGLTPENEGFLKYTRAHYREQKATEARAELFARIRREGQRGKLSQEIRKEFYDEQRRMLRNGQRMSYKTPYELLRQTQQ